MWKSLLNYGNRKFSLGFTGSLTPSDLFISISILNEDLGAPCTLTGEPVCKRTYLSAGLNLWTGSQDRICKKITFKTSNGLPTINPATPPTFVIDSSHSTPSNSESNLLNSRRQIKKCLVHQAPTIDEKEDRGLPTEETRTDIVNETEENAEERPRGVVVTDLVLVPPVEEVGCSGISTLIVLITFSACRTSKHTVTTEKRALNSRTSERDRKDEKYDRERRINKSRSRSPRKDDVSKASGEPSNNVPDDMNLDDDPEQAMMKLMGLTGFGSTKGKKVQGNDFAAVSIKKQRQYRQYMNRRGGFN
ncbi:6193_t:CDS:2, partial [Acaulospora morrowiae]